MSTIWTRIRWWSLTSGWTASTKCSHAMVYPPLSVGGSANTSTRSDHRTNTGPSLLSSSSPLLLPSCSEGPAFAPCSAQTKHLQFAVASKDVLALLSPALQGELVWMMHKPWLSRVAFFKGTEPEFLVQIALSLSPIVFAPGELATSGFLYIVHRGIALYGGRVLTSGKVHACMHMHFRTFATYPPNSIWTLKGVGWGLHHPVTPLYMNTIGTLYGHYMDTIWTLHEHYIKGVGRGLHHPVTPFAAPLVCTRYELSRGVHRLALHDDMSTTCAHYMSTIWSLYEHYMSTVWALYEHCMNYL